MTREEKMDLVGSRYVTLQNNSVFAVKLYGMFDVAWQLIYGDRNEGDFCLVKLLNGEVGIADRGLKGYTPTNVWADEEVDVGKEVEWFNKNVLLLGGNESARIIASTM